MSQTDWDYLEKNKQDIVDGKVLCETWDFEIFEGLDDTLTMKEMIEVFKRFPEYSREGVLYEVAFETLECIADDVISEREEAAV